MRALMPNEMPEIESIKLLRTMKLPGPLALHVL